MAKGIEEVAALPDPVGRVLKRVERPNGLVIEKTAEMCIRDRPFPAPHQSPSDAGYFLAMPYHKNVYKGERFNGY